MKLAEPVAKAVIEAYYPVALAAPEVARIRAQAAFSIASVVASGLLGGLLLLPANRLVGASAVCTLAAFVAWLFASALYLRAVAIPVDLPTDNWGDRDDFVRDVIDKSHQARVAIDRRQRQANWAAAVAAIATVIAVSTLVLGGENRSNATLNFNSNADLPPACGLSNSLSGLLLEDDKTADYFDLLIGPGVCGQGEFRLLIGRSVVDTVELQ